MEKSEDTYKRLVLVEKKNSIVQITVKRGCCGWCYGSSDGMLFEVRNGSKEDLKNYNGYIAHLTKDWFYIITTGKYIGNKISKAHAIKVK